MPWNVIVFTQGPTIYKPRHIYTSSSCSERSAHTHTHFVHSHKSLWIVRLLFFNLNAIRNENNELPRQWKKDTRQRLPSSERPKTKEEEEEDGKKKEERNVFEETSHPQSEIVRYFCFSLIRWRKLCASRARLMTIASGNQNVPFLSSSTTASPMPLCVCVCAFSWNVFV